jgi:hypothetical protein
MRFSLKEFQSHDKLDQHAKTALSIQLMQQRLELAKLNTNNGTTTATTLIQTNFYVARLLGRPLHDLQMLGCNQRHQDCHLFSHQILLLTFCQPQVFLSTTDCLNFHKGLDQALVIVRDQHHHMNNNHDSRRMTTDMATATGHAPPPPPLEEFYQLAKKASDDPEAVVICMEQLWGLAHVVCARFFQIPNNWSSLTKLIHSET